MLKNKKKKSNKFTNLLKLINEFENWKKQNNVENIVENFISRTVYFHIWLILPEKNAYRG